MPVTPEAGPGERIGRYELRERLGAGGMGIVYAAWDPELDRRVAIKFVRRGQAVSPELLRRRLRREAQAMARLRHPNVVAVYDVGETEGQLFVAMEYVDGINLRKWLQTRPRSVAEILAVFRAAGEGLAAAHAEGIIHRDFKPDNVLVAGDGKVLVLDFGLASWVTSPGSDSGRDSGSDDLESKPESSEESLRVASVGASGTTLDETGLTRPGAVLGTLNYMAPEQRRGRAIDARTDQYSFCVALWQALSGELPYGQGSSSRSLARARVGRLDKLDRKVPARVERALRRGLAWQPEDRWPSMRVLLDALEQPKPRRRWWFAASAVLTGSAVAWMLSADDPGSTPRSCDEQSERVAAVWNASIADELAGVISARSEFARRNWPYLRADLERWTKRWQAVDLELCERYGLGVAPKVHELQLLCLDRQLEHFSLATDLLATATADELEHGFDLLARLPDPSLCRDTTFSEARTGVDTAQLAELDEAIERAELEFQLGRVEAVDTATVELLETSKAFGFEPLHVRVAELRGSALAKLDRRDEAIDVGFSGLAAAEREGSAALRLRAFINLAELHINTAQDLQGAQRWLAQAQAIAAEQEFERELLRDLANTEGWVTAVGGRLDDGLAAFDRALALADPESDALERASIMISRAQLLGWMSKPEQALEQFEVGERELVAIIGADHPTVLDMRYAKAQIMKRLDQWQPARAELLEVADSLEALRGRPTTISIAARSKAAFLLDRLGDCEGARAEFDRMIPLAREHMAYPSPDLGALLTDRAMLCGHASPESIAFAREALELYRKAVGDQHVMVADTRRMLARTLYEAGELEAAREEVEAALTIFAAVAPIGAEFVPLAEALKILIRHAQGEPEALDGVEGVIGKLPDDDALRRRLVELR
ncbi:MAG TPA: serine/threonine-protein kinase [Enhygromyxa sp.]|nr:serine/threonine-protein kinase [Enhygromyxa sp.]